MGKKFNIEDDICFLQQILTKIIQNAPKNIRPRIERFDELEKYLFTWSLMSDDYSHNLYGRILSSMFAMEFMDNKADGNLFPIWSEEFDEQYKFNRETVIVPDLKRPNESHAQTIFQETFLCRHIITMTSAA